MFFYDNGDESFLGFAEFLVCPELEVMFLEKFSEDMFNPHSSNLRLS